MPFYEKYNVINNRSFKIDISEEVLYSIKKYIELDEDLYSYTKKMFTDQICAMGADFLKEVLLFKQINELV